MMRLLFLIPVLFLFGCALPTNKGGSGRITQERTSITIDPNTNISTTTNETISVDLNQPDNPNEPATVTFRNGPDETEVRINTSGSQNTTKDVANINSLAKVTYAGIALVLAALALGIFGKGRYLFQALILGGVGIGFIILAYLLPAYTLWFAVGSFVIIAGYFGFIVWKYVNRDKALDDTIKNLDFIKDKVLTPEQKQELFKTNNAPIPLMQANETRKIVDAKRKKRK